MTAFFPQEQTQNVKKREKIAPGRHIHTTLLHKDKPGKLLFRRMYSATCKNPELPRLVHFPLKSAFRQFRPLQGAGKDGGPDHRHFLEPLSTL
ncbi:hypothetical protein [Kiloniella sp. b19]|uniref:hypothetical protein n=1 Tax=Kiloniella sp. GXU_MW_B19 TaxID=3141326 RepID=UPI0031D8AE47